MHEYISQRLFSLWQCAKVCVWEQYKSNRVTVKLSIQPNLTFFLLFLVASPTYSAEREHCNVMYQIMYGYDPVAIQR